MVGQMGLEPISLTAADFKSTAYTDSATGPLSDSTRYARITPHPPLAQLVEQIPLKDKVVGSIPTGRTNVKKTCSRQVFSLSEPEPYFSPRKMARQGREFQA